jgi:hypothetical protein
VVRVHDEQSWRCGAGQWTINHCRVAKCSLILSNCPWLLRAPSTPSLDLVGPFDLASYPGAAFRSDRFVLLVGLTVRRVSEKRRGGPS